MPKPTAISEEDIPFLLSDEQFRQGLALLDNIHETTVSGDTLMALVQDGQRVYLVAARFQDDEIYISCDCPRGRDGLYCPHLAALFIKWARAPQEFAVVEESGTAATDEFPFPVLGVRAPAVHRPEQLPAWVEQTLADRRAADAKDLSRWLNQLTIREMRTIAGRRGWKLKGTLKADIIAQVAQHITDPEDTRQTVAQLNPVQRRVLRALVLLSEHGHYPPSKLLVQAAMLGAPSTAEMVNFAAVAAQLCDLGLAFPQAPAASGYFGRTAHTPPLIARHFPPLLADMFTAPAVRSDAENVIPADPYPFLQTFGQVLSLLSQTSPALRPPMPIPTAGDVARLVNHWTYDPHELNTARLSRRLYGASATLSVPPPRPRLDDEAVRQLSIVAGGEMRLEFIYSLLEAAGIVYPGSPVTIWKEVYDHFLMRDDLSRRALLARTYFQMTNWSVLWEVIRQDKRLQLRRVPASGLTPASLHEDLMHFRRLLLCALSSLPDDEWVSLADFLAVMRVVWPRFDMGVWSPAYRHYRTPFWFLADANTREPLKLDEDAAAWDMAQGAFIRQTIAGPLHWLGLTDLVFDEQDNLTAFRLHGLADLFWDRVEVVAAPPLAVKEEKELQPEDILSYDGETISVVPSAIGVRGHDLLHKIAVLESTTARKFVYRPDADVTFRSFTQGLTGEEIIRRWEEDIPVPLPEGLRETLQKWWASYGRVRLYRDLTVIEFGDDYALREMRAVTDLDRYILAEISPRLVVIAPEGIEPLKEALEKAGYTPSVKTGV